MTTDEHLDSRIRDLEEKLAFQEDALDALNQIVTQQSLELQKLWDANRLLKQKIQEVAVPQNEVDQPPPHY